MGESQEKVSQVGKRNAINETYDSLKDKYDTFDLDQKKELVKKFGVALDH
jgi:hypothetical protein